MFKKLSVAEWGLILVLVLLVPSAFAVPSPPLANDQTITGVLKSVKVNLFDYKDAYVVLEFEDGQLLFANFSNKGHTLFQLNKINKIVVDFGGRIKKVEVSKESEKK